MYLIMCSSKFILNLTLIRLHSLKPVFAHYVNIGEFQDELGLINAFTGCIVQLINFLGKNINFKILTTPIILLHYFSFLNAINLYPIELLPALKSNQKLMKKTLFAYHS